MSLSPESESNFEVLLKMRLIEIKSAYLKDILILMNC